MKKPNIILSVTTLVLGVAMVGNGIFAADSSQTKNEKIQWTINFLKKQESQNIDEVEAEINKVNKDTSIVKFDMNKAKSRFEDVVFLGDSITEYLREANILNPSSVLAQKGEHVNQANKHLSEIKNLKPKEIVVLYGANDINAYSPEKYKEEYVKLINEIKKVSPSSTIYLQAPLPVNEAKTVNKDSRINNENVKLLTQKTKQVASITGAKFLSSDGLVTSDSLFEQDGVHFKYEFYKNWLYFLSENI
ncbi:GDSL-type esterase/lipase family protein [Peptostreptococcus porci]|uniref:Acetylhydrolase n=1 Tax=Peptostreptococcus porci TaxID=2652282 RepID=A0A6N7XDR3_9FIRM|nr:GDSL-type esterase/lipase family protein [Peptostreptococcus porci]MDY4560277.1 GDSL-type esterase/lipase family protein [Peptostreptococcus porci]MDY5435235.1 GDSL-type esterase/lipase family protein [Peptostreptococcus porci]MST62816.1 acetylhydrolase [Peptostreptococcus porci]